MKTDYLAIVDELCENWSRMGIKYHKCQNGLTQSCEAMALLLEQVAEFSIFSTKPNPITQQNSRLRWWRNWCFLLTFGYFWQPTTFDRALSSHQCGLGSIPARCHRWVEFVVGSRLAPRVFLLVLWFSSLHNNQHSKFQFVQERGPAWKPAKADVASSLNIVIYFIEMNARALIGRSAIVYCASKLMEISRVFWIII